ncbi:unnamed protein product, partial [Owenia fusiformis]
DSVAVPEEESDSPPLLVGLGRHRPTSLKINVLDDPKIIQNKPIAGYAAGSINSIAGLPNGHYVMNVKDEIEKIEKALLFDNQWNMKKTLVPENVSCVASTKDTIAVSSTANEFGVRLFDTRGSKIRDIKLFTIKKPIAIAFNKPQELLIADDEKKFISRINITSGKVIDTTPTDMFKSSYSITVTSENNILIADCVGESVKFINTKGDLLSTYTGKGDHTLLCPLSICVDSVGQVIIADYWKHNIQLLSPQGEYKKTLLSGKDGLRNPTAVVLNNKGELVIGCSKPAQMYVLKYMA